MDLSPPSSPDEEGYQPALEEARRVVDHQISEINRVDDNTARLLRLILILLGVVASATQLPNLTIEFTLIVEVGVGVLVLSLLVGAWTFSSSLAIGPAVSHHHSFQLRGLGKERVQRSLIDLLTQAIQENEKVLRMNNTGLLLTRVLFGIGVALVAIGLMLNGISF